MMKDLRVGFDGRALVSPAGGVRRYTRALFGAIAAMGDGPEVVAIGAPADVDLPPRVTAGAIPPRAPTNLGWTLWSIPIGCGRAAVDVYHAPAYTCPWWGVPPTVLTVHDYSYERCPEWYPHRRDPLRRLFYRRSAVAADVIITDSEFSKREILSAYSVPPEGVVVVPLAASDVFSPAPAEIGQATEAEPYLLHVGDLHPRRDVATAVEALARTRRLPACGDLRLVLVGIDRGQGADLSRVAKTAGVSHAVDCREDVSDPELVTLYRGATALVYTSRYEGFGLPLVEAMASGTPVVAAAAGPTPEVVDEAAVLVEPGDVAGFAEAVHRLLIDKEHRYERSRAGIARASTFSWTRAAEQTVAIYRSVWRASSHSVITEPQTVRSAPAGGTGPELTVIVVNYNGRNHLERCLDALARQTVDHEVIVVDNGSRDDSCDVVRQRYPAVRLIELRRNAGFAAANNAGAAAARGQYFAFLNNDTKPASDWLEALRNGLDTDRAHGFATSRIVYLDDPSTVDSAGDVVTRWGGAFKRGHGERADSVAQSDDVFAACGAACLFRREVFEEVGGFDEAFFLVFEDVDLSYRAQLRGYRCVYVPAAIVGHAGSATLGRVSRTAVYYGQRNLEWLYLKNTPGVLLLLTLPGHMLYAAASAVYYTSRGALRPFASGKWDALKGVARVWRQRRTIQRGRRVPARDVWRRLERRWLVRKIREKRFDFGLARLP